MNGKQKQPRILITDNGKPETYVNAVEKAGGIAVVGCEIPEGTEYDGLLLTGGCDVNPARYGQAINGAQKINDERDERELNLVRLFAAQNKPIFGICRGHQLLNVAFGGTLIQDLPGHRSTEQRKIFHDVIAVPGSALEQVYGERFPVNSYHHQAVDRAADGFQIVARSAADGIIEGISHPEHPWFSVQFHPEKIPDGNENAVAGIPLFRYFLSLCQ